MMPAGPRVALHAALLAAALAVPASGQPERGGGAAGTFAYDRRAPLVLRASLQRVKDGLEMHAVSFASPRGGWASGLLYVPRRTGRRAGIVLLHGAPGNARSVDAIAARFARHNAVVLSIDAPFARRGGEAVTFTPADSADQVQIVVDLQRAVDVLAARADVDPARIAFVGGSYGAAVGAMYAAVDRRPAAFVLSMGDGGLASHFTGADGERVGPARQMTGAAWARWVAAMRPVEGIRHLGRARPGSILFQNARNDRLVPPFRAERLHRAAGRSHTVKWYAGGHFLSEQARADRLRWLHERIGTDPPARPTVPARTSRA